MVDLAASNSGYEPSDGVKWFHDTGRWDQHFHSVSSDFPNLSDHDQTETWLKGIFWHAAAIIGVGGALALLIFTGYLVAGCCCSAPQPRDPQEYEELMQNERHSPQNGKDRPYNRKRMITMIILSFVFLGIALFVFKPVHTLSEKYHDGLKAIRSTRDVLTDAKTASSSAQENLHLAVTNTENVLECASDNHIVYEFYTNVSVAATHINDAVSGMDQLLKHLNTIIDHGKDSRNKGNEFSYNVAGIMCFTVIVLLITMIPSRPCAIGYKGCSVPLNILFLILLWVTTAMIFAVGAMFSDFCYKPDHNAMISIDGATGASSVSAKSVHFYVNCNSTTEDDNGGIHSLVRRTVADVETAQDHFPRVNETVYAGNCGKRAKKFSRVSQNIDATLSHLKKSQDNLVCQAIQKPWHSFRGNLCDDVITKGIVPLLGALTVLSVLLSIILMFGWTVCVQHPGKRDHVQYHESNGAHIEGTSMYPSTAPYNIQESNVHQRL